MDEIELDEIISEIKILLNKHETEPEPQYWLYPEAQTQYDEGFTFCWDCLHEIVPHAIIGEHFGGGYYCEEDGSEICEKCGKLLQYTLTDYGVDNELDHFAECSLESLDDGYVCYELARIAYGVYTEEQKLKLIEITKPFLKKESTND